MGSAQILSKLRILHADSRFKECVQPVQSTGCSESSLISEKLANLKLIIRTLAAGTLRWLSWHAVLDELVFCAGCAGTVLLNSFSVVFRGMPCTIQ